MSEVRIDGWTTPRNETFILVVRNEFNAARLTRTLIHEMAISYDRKEQIGFGGIVDVPKLGILEDEDSCLSLSILRNAKVKHTLSAARAFDMERRIANELGLPLPDGFALWAGKSCLDKMGFLESYLTPLSGALTAEDLVNTLMDQPLCMAPRIPVSNFQQGIQLLNELTFTFADGTRRNACEYLSEGWPYYAGISFRGGPGPRIGGGGWKELSDFTVAPKLNGLSKQLVQPKGQTKIKQKALDAFIEKRKKQKESFYESAE